MHNFPCQQNNLPTLTLTSLGHQVRQATACFEVAPKSYSEYLQLRVQQKRDFRLSIRHLQERENLCSSRFRILNMYIPNSLCFRLSPIALFSRPKSVDRQAKQLDGHSSVSKSRKVTER